MKAEELTNPIVRTVVTAMRDSDRKTFFAAFSPSAKLTDDGNPVPLAEWVDREIFRAHGRLYVESEDRDGLELTGRFESDQWDMLTVWRFEIVNERIQRLDVAAV
ncbi:MAG: nuclear transport factor 2 family protein [Thermoproteota archaeon]|nr:nuclear transport factor 2 family protein [Thermoproteota archaeon]